jgi:Tfp pilus assembly protein PilO
VGRRGPVIAGIASLLVSVVAVFFLVLPKLSEVSAARQDLADARSEQQTLESRFEALRDAQASAPEAEATIRQVERQIPPTVDVQSVILLLDNAASQSGISLRTFTPGSPAFDDASGLTMMDVQATVQGTYFSLDEFLYRVETLPRAARVLNITIGAAQQEATGVPTTSSTLAMSSTIRVFTSDASAGPGSDPGPTEPTGGV